MLLLSLAQLVRWSAVNLSKVRYLPIPAVLALVGYLAYDNRHSLMPRQRLPGLWQQISAGGEHTCAVDRTDGVVCWGKAAGGRTSPPAVPLTSVSVGGEHACGLRVDGEAVCWGVDYKGCTRPPAGPFIRLSAGWAFTCAIRVDQTLACWGENRRGQSTPPAGKFTQVAAGPLHSCAVDVDGAVVCWGDNVAGKLQAPGGTYKQVVVGKCHSCGLRPDGSAVCWGCNPPDDHAPDGRNTPPKKTFTQLAAGHLHLCGLQPDGAVDCWGHNALGESDDPQGAFRQVTAGYFHTCGLKTDGKIMCWGWASHTTRRQANRLEGRQVIHKSLALQRHTCPYEGLGLLYLSQGREDHAARHFKTAVKVSPDREPRQYIHLAHIHVNKGRYREAERLLAKARTLVTHQGEINRMVRRIARLRGDKVVPDLPEDDGATPPAAITPGPPGPAPR